MVDDEGQRTANNNGNDNDNDTVPDEAAQRQGGN
jgi:hypothetical protein